jgi:hypothetical protein
MLRPAEVSRIRPPRLISRGQRALPHRLKIKYLFDTNSWNYLVEYLYLQNEQGVWGHKVLEEATDTPAIGASSRSGKKALPVVIIVSKDLFFIHQ